MKLVMYTTVLAVCLVTVGCSATKSKRELGQIERKRLVCIEETSCKQALAESCKRGGVLHGVTPGIVIEYSCNP